MALTIDGFTTELNRRSEINIGTPLRHNPRCSVRLQSSSILLSSNEEQSGSLQPTDTDDDKASSSSSPIASDECCAALTERLEFLDTTLPMATTTTTTTITCDSNMNDDDMKDWDWKTLAESVFTTEEQRPIVLFDGVCTLCDATINFVMDHDTTAKLRFCSLQSRTAQALLLQAGLSPTDTDRMILVTPTKTYFTSEAVSHICQRLDPLPFQVLGWVGQRMPRSFREPVYHFVSNRRHVFGENLSCRLDFDGIFTSRFISDPSDV